MAAGAPPLCADVRARRGAPTRRARRPARALRSRRAPGGGSTTADSRAALQDVALARAPGAPGGLLLALAGAPGVVLLRAAPEPAHDERGQPAAADDDRQGQPAAEHGPAAPAPAARAAWRWRRERTLLHRWPACAVALTAAGAGGAEPALAAAGLAGQLWLWRLRAGGREPELVLQASGAAAGMRCGGQPHFRCQGVRASGAQTVLVALHTAAMAFAACAVDEVLVLIVALMLWRCVVTCHVLQERNHVMVGSRVQQARHRLRVTAQAQVPAERVTALAFSPCAGALAALCWGGALSLYDALPSPSGPSAPEDAAPEAPPAAAPPAGASLPEPEDGGTPGLAPVAAPAPPEHVPRVMAIEHELPPGSAPALGLTLSPACGPWRPRARLPGQPVRPEQTAASLLLWDAAGAKDDAAALGVAGPAAGPGCGAGGRLLLSRRGEPVESCAAAGAPLVCLLAGLALTSAPLRLLFRLLA